ncbi:hypothetical protein [Alteribacter natronophilus]|uniref:hypothetical protein n=1 Tax=Alteribacter natronophilus TaxID=2583810 RepID=UPI00110EE077|nr:hypothetical protein [Alteribacter natronophilus]TMW72925.1 hypothetical protein FGB90_01025 [Alteribacter natronophilus]
MKIFYFGFCVLPVPFLILYADYYGRFIGEIEWIGYTHWLQLFYLGFAILLGFSGSRIRLRWFVAGGLLSIVLQVILMNLMIDPANSWWFSPFTANQIIVISSSLYFFIQFVVRGVFKGLSIWLMNK